jgi:GxxExxY protein
MEESHLRSLNHITSVVLDSAIRVHKAMGPGLLEGVYQECLIDELTSRGCDVCTRPPILQWEKTYKGLRY